jgi:hypothetical protein
VATLFFIQSDRLGFKVVAGCHSSHTMAGSCSSTILVPKGFRFNTICEAAPLLQLNCRKHLRDWPLTDRLSAENGKKLLSQTSLKQAAIMSKGFLAERLGLARKFEECSQRQNFLDKMCEGGAESKRKSSVLTSEARTALPDVILDKTILSQKDAPKIEVAGGLRIESAHKMDFLGERQKDGAGNKATIQQAGIQIQQSETADFGALSDGVIAAIQKHDPGVILESNDELVRECWRMRKERKSKVTDDLPNRMVALIGLKTLR